MNGDGIRLQVGLIRIIISFGYILLLEVMTGKSISAQAVNVEMRQFSSNAGLSMTMVNDMLLDQEGYMWLAAYGGLAKFDGMSFSNFEPVGKAFKSIKFTCLVEDEKGNIWTIGQDAGFDFHLFIFNKAQHQLTPFVDSQLANLPPSIRALAPISIGTFFMVTANEEVFLYKNGEVKLLFQTPNQNPIRNLKQDTNELIIVCEDNSFYAIPIESYVRIESASLPGSSFPLPASLPTDMNIDGHQANVLSPPHYLSATLSLVPRPIFPYDIPIWFYQRQLTPDIHWAFSRKEMHIYLPARNIWLDLSYLLEDYPKTQGIKCSLVDHYNNVWIGTNDGIFSITAFVPIAKTAFSGKDEVDNAYSFRGITKWNGQIYANSYSGKVVFDPGNNTESFFYQSRERGHLLAAHKGKNGSLWMSKSDQLQRFLSPEEAPEVYDLPYIPNVQRESLEIWSIFEDDEGNVWLGTSVGLAVWHYKHKEIRYLPNRNSDHPIGDAKIHHISPLGSGLGLATANGFSYYHFDRGFNLTDEKYSSLIHQSAGFAIYHSLIEESGDLWLASNGDGLFHWNVEKQDLAQYSQSAGFTNNNLHAVYEDHLGGLWIPSENGLFLFDKQKKVASETSLVLGFDEKEFNRLAHFQDEDGHLYFGGIAGIQSFHPSAYHAAVKDESIPLYLLSIRLIDRKKDKTVEVAQGMKDRNVLISAPYATQAEIAMSNLGQFDVFEYKWKSEEANWNTSSLPTIQLTSFPIRSDELWIRGVGKHGMVSDILAIPFVLETEIPFMRYGLFFLLGGAFLLVGGYVIKRIRYRKESSAVNGASVSAENEISPVVDEELSPLSGAFVTKLDRIIESNIVSSTFGIDELSDALCLSRKSLYRKVKQYTGKNPNEYIRIYRLEYARQLLRETDLGIAEISYKAGFASTSYFSICYKKHFGLSPKEERKR
nr:helix-turn-helix domain-containing protein [Cytophagales bacterium]